MPNSWKHNGKAYSIPGGLTMGVTVSMCITITLSALIAMCLDSERITWQEAGYWIMGMLFFASFIGGKCAVRAIKRQHIAVCMMCGAAYWGFLICTTALLFGGDYGAVWETAGIIMAGTGTAAMITPKISNKKQRRQRNRYCKVEQKQKRVNKNYP